MSYTSPFTGDVIIPTDVSYQSIDLTSNVELVWPVFANNTNTVAARIMDVTPNAGSRTLTMPPANQVSVGQDALFKNPSAYSFTVLNNDGGTICTVSAGKSQYIYVTDNTTTAGVWGVIAFGATTASADASVLAGLGLIAIANTLNQSHPTSVITNGSTFADSDRAQTKVWESGSGTLNLPAVASVGDNWFLLFKNNGTGTVTIDCSSAETIDGSLTKNFAPAESAIIVCTGAEYITIGYGQSSTFVFNALVKPVTSGTYILTPAEARNTIQEYVGTLSGDVIAQYPPAVNLYVISNQTVDNGYGLTITTGIVGGANAIVPPGNQVTLICDGTNFLNANTTQSGLTTVSLLNGSVGTPSLNFGTESSTGLYHAGTGQLNVAVLGNDIADFSATGLNVNGVGNFAGGIEGGVFS